MTDFTVDVGTARLAGTEWGPPQPDTLVALHAGVADRRMWAGCAPAWTDAGWRLVAHDRRGYGDSEWEAGPHDHLADLVAVLDDRDVDRAVFVGSSMGGALAIDLALAQPDRVRALVLACSAVSGQTEWAAEPSDDDQRLSAAIEQADEAGDDDEVNRLECHYWLDGPSSPEGRVGGAARELFLDMNGRALLAPATGEPQPSPGAWDRLADVAVPTLVIVGLLDERDCVAVSRKLVAEIPGAELVELPASAHLPALDATDRFAEIVTDFLTHLER